jgi:hypothetical protein
LRTYIAPNARDVPISNICGQGRCRCLRIEAGAMRTAKSMAILKPIRVKYTTVRFTHLAPGTFIVHKALNGVQRHIWMMMKATDWVIRIVIRT